MKVFYKNGDSMERFEDGTMKAWDADGKLLMVFGRADDGEAGVWVDESGLCKHERVEVYCGDCQKMQDPPLQPNKETEQGDSR